MLSKQLYRQEYPTGKKPEKSQIALVLAVNLFTRIFYTRIYILIYVFDYFIDLLSRI